MFCILKVGKVQKLRQHNINSSQNQRVALGKETISRAFEYNTENSKMNMLAVFCSLFLNFESSFAEQWRREATVESHEHLYNPSNNKTGIKVSSVTECSHKCFYTGNSCVGANFHIEKIKGRHSCELAYHDEGKEKFLEKIGWIYLQPIEKKKKILQVKLLVCIFKFPCPVCTG